MNAWGGGATEPASNGPRVLQAMAGGRHGGAESFFDRLVPALGRAGLSQRALIRPSPERLSGLARAGIPTVSLHYGGPLDLASRWRFGAEIRRHRPDIVLTWMSRASATCPRGRFVHAARFGGYYSFKYFRRCDHLVGNTKALCDYMLDGGWPAKRVHYLPNFVSAERLAPVARASHETPEGVPLLLALGRLHAIKGYDVLLAALPRSSNWFRTGNFTVWYSCWQAYTTLAGAYIQALNPSGFLNSRGCLLPITRKYSCAWAWW